MSIFVNNTEIYDTEQSEPSGPVLLWPGNIGDFSRFPSADVLHARRGNRKPGHSSMPPLQTFVQAILHAQRRVWIIDGNFGDPSIHDDLVGAFGLTPASSLLFITTRASDAAKAALKQIRIDREDRFPPPHHGATWREGLDATSFPFLHDRFALIDGELWHFGGTVGGHQEILTAASRGWISKENGADDFFDLVESRLEGSSA